MYRVLSRSRPLLHPMGNLRPAPISKSTPRATWAASIRTQGAPLRQIPKAIRLPVCSQSQRTRMGHVVDFLKAQSPGLGKTQVCVFVCFREIRLSELPQAVRHRGARTIAHDNGERTEFPVTAGP